VDRVDVFADLQDALEAAPLDREETGEDNMADEPGLMHATDDEVQSRSSLANSEDNGIIDFDPIDPPRRLEGTNYA
jgi:hypothetical protein